MPLWQKFNQEKPSSKDEFLALNKFQIWCKKSEKSNESFISVRVSMVVNGQTCTLDRQFIDQSLIHVTKKHKQLKYLAAESFITSYFNTYLALVLYSLTFLLLGQLTTNSHFTKLTFYALRTSCSFWYFQNLIICCQDFFMKLFCFNGWYINCVIWTQLKDISVEKGTWFSKRGSRAHPLPPLSYARDFQLKKFIFCKY